MSWQPLIDAILGPLGATVVLMVIEYFTWKLFREEQAENRKTFSTVTTLTDTVKELTIEVRAWRSGRRVT
jgi:hypothetical protein